MTLKGIAKTFQEVFGIVQATTGSKRILLSLLIFQLLALLDFLGVIIFGIIGSVILNGINPQFEILNLERYLLFDSLANLSLQTKVLVLTIFGLVLLITRSISSIYFTRRNLIFLGNRAADLSGKLIQSALVKGNHQSDISTSLYTVTTGVQQLFSQVVANLLTTTADILLSFTFLIGILLIDPTTSFVVGISFALMAVVFNKFISKRVKENGREIGILFRKSQQDVIDTISLYREIRLRSLEGNFGARIARGRYDLLTRLVPYQIFGLINKYLIEIFLLVILSTVAGVLFLIYDAGTGFAKLTIFFVAASRMAPAVMRLQNSLIQISSHLEQSRTTLDAIRELPLLSEERKMEYKEIRSLLDEKGPPRLLLKDVKFEYTDEGGLVSGNSIQVKELLLESGQKYSITGKSGSGKSTLVDLILGFKSPDSGKIYIDDLDLTSLENNLGGVFGYVPQDVYIFPGTLRENVTLFDPKYENRDSEILRALSISGLSEWTLGLPKGLDTMLGNGGVVPSGGQRQRIGLARCLISQPKVIVLDEITSGLDEKTEEALIEQLSKIPWENTQLLVTHRAALRQFADFEIRISDTGNVKLVEHI